MKVNYNNIDTLEQNNAKRATATGSFHDRKVDSFNSPKKVYLQKINLKNKIYKKITDFMVRHQDSKNILISRFESKSYKNVGLNILIKNGYKKNEAKDILANINNNTITKQQFFASLSDIPTAKQKNQGYTSRKDFYADLKYATSHFRDLGYNNGEQSYNIAQNSQNLAEHRNDFLAYVRNTPKAYDANKGYMSQLDVNNDIKWAENIFIEVGNSPENATVLAETLQKNSFSRKDFIEHVQQVNIASFNNRLKLWAENTLAAKGYEQTEITEIFENLLLQVVDLDNIIEVINSLPTKGQEFSYSEYSRASFTEKIKLKKAALNILKLNSGATPKEISTAYKKLALKYHPDKNPDPEAPAKFSQIQQAYELLTKSSK